MSLRYLSILVASVAALCTQAASFAQTITAQLSSSDGFVDEPMRVVVNVINFDDFDGPFFDEVPGLQITRLPGEQTQTSIQIANGRRVQTRTVGISYEVIPHKAGTFVIPAFMVQSGGQKYTTNPTQITVAASDAGELMIVRVVGEPHDLYLGQEGGLNLELAVKAFKDRALGISLDEQSMWSLIDLERSSWGIFGPALQKMLSENRRPRGEMRVIAGTEYIVYTISKSFDPIATGTPSVGEVRVRMEYPTRLQRGNDFFNQSRLTLGGSRAISITPSAVDATVIPVPDGPRPASWNGAVGRFGLQVIAKPLEVSVGDPITLTMRITDQSGIAGLAGLQAPVLADQPAFASGFRVPRESASGTVEGRTKVFTQSIRALGDNVREIPPVELAFFDPGTGSYEIVRSAAIPIKVKPSTVARVDVETPQAAREGKSELTKVDGGILANASLDQAMGSLPNETMLPALALVAPACFAVATAIRLRSDAQERNPLARRRRGARGSFERRLAEPAADGGASADAIGAAVLAYIADRVGAPEGSLAGREAVEALAAARLDKQLIDEADDFLRRCDRARYAGASIDAAEARALVARLDAAAWREGGAR